MKFSRLKKLLVGISAGVLIATGYHISNKTTVESKHTIEHFDASVGENTTKKSTRISYKPRTTHIRTIPDAIRQHDHRELLYLLSRGYDPNYRDKIGLFPLAYAVKYKDLESFAILQEHGANEDKLIYINDDGYIHPVSLLEYAAFLNSDVSLVDQLIRSGVKFAFTNNLESFIAYAYVRNRRLGHELLVMYRDALDPNKVINIDGVTFYSL